MRASRFGLVHVESVHTAVIIYTCGAVANRNPAPGARIRKDDMEGLLAMKRQEA
jgi:hypothetical protein